MPNYGILIVMSYDVIHYLALFSYDELLVGAPMYTLLDPLFPEQGRLYVFFNNGVSAVLNNMGCSHTFIPKC